MNDPILREIRHSLAESTDGNWFTTPASPSGEHVIYASCSSGGSQAVAKVHSEADAHLLAHAKGYIAHLLNLLEREKNKNDPR